MVDFGQYLKKGWEAEKQMKYLNRCSKNYHHEGKFYIVLMRMIGLRNIYHYNIGNMNTNIAMGFIFIIIFPAISMFIAVKFFLRRRSNGGGMPPKYGPYQRNLVTLSQTVQFFIFFILTEVFLAVFLTILESRAIARYFFCIFIFLVLTCFQFIVKLWEPSCLASM